tara:strand:+ start:559 stop:1071 length:513 start_codon:yes stop_codon:yes gene_type:complete
MTSILKVDSIQNAAGTSAMTIDSSGRILQPARPMFHVTKTGSDQAVTSTTALINWTDIVTDIGGHFSLTDNDYTIPVSGMYNLQCALRGQGDSATMELIMLFLHVDGVLSKNLSQVQTENNQLKNSHLNGSVSMFLNAGQKVSFRAQVRGSNAAFGADERYTYCSGYLIG